MEPKTYKSNHIMDILTKLNEERKSSKKFCDGIISLGTNKFESHRCILSHGSQFFDTYFTEEMEEKQENHANCIQKVTSNTMEIVLNYIYTGEITITTKNVYDLIEAATLMEIPNLHGFCSDFLCHDVDVSNCLKIRAHAKRYNLDQLLQKVDSVIAKNFDRFLADKGFIDLEETELSEIMEMEDIKVASEENVYRGLLDWLKKDINSRGKHLEKYFNFINLKRLTKDFLRQVVSKEDLIMNCTICRDKIVQFLFTMKPAPETTGKILAFHGQRVWKYDVETKISSEMPKTCFDHSQGSAVCHHNKVYVISGEDKEVEMLDLDEKLPSWVQLASTNVRRRRSASVIYDDSIITTGGWMGVRQSTASGERYNIASNKWTDIAEMKQKRHGHASLNHDEYLYVIGGHDQSKRLDSIERTNSLKEYYMLNSPTKTKRDLISAVSLNGEIYVIGGSEGVFSKLKTVERFNPQNETWSNVADMKVGRRQHGACVVDGKIFVVGGGSTAVEVYDPQMNTWKIVDNISALKDVQFCVAV